MLLARLSSPQTECAEVVLQKEISDYPYIKNRPEGQLSIGGGYRFCLYFSKVLSLSTLARLCSSSNATWMSSQSYSSCRRRWMMHLVFSPKICSSVSPSSSDLSSGCTSATSCAVDSLCACLMNCFSLS